MVRSRGEGRGHRRTGWRSPPRGVEGRRTAVSGRTLGQCEGPAVNPWGAFGKAGPLDPAPFVYPVANFYMTDPITRASATMAKCAEAFLLPKARTGTHG